MIITPDDIADLTTLILAAALEPARWQDFLDHLHKLSGGARTHIFGRDMATGRLFGHIGAGYDDSHMIGYDQYYRHQNVWVDRFALSPNGAYMRIAEMYPLEDLFKTEFYNDWVRPQDDMYGGGGVMLFNEQDRFLAFGGHIPASLIDGIETDFERLIRLLSPHVQQASEINRALDGKAIAEFVADVNGNAATAVLLLGPSGRILFANSAADTWIARGTPIYVDTLGRLTSKQSEISDFLDQALHALELPISAPSHLLTKAGADAGSELRLHAARFVPDRQVLSPFGVLHSGNDRALLVTIERKATLRDQVTEILHAHQLTSSEIEVAVALGEGIPVKEISERRQVSIHTVRNQRQSILHKLDLRSQSQLVRMISQLDRS